MEGAQESPETTETMEGKTQGTQESPEITETMESKTQGTQESHQTTETKEGKTQKTQESPETTETMEGKTQGTQESPETTLQFISSADNDFQMTSERRKASDLWSNEEMDQCGEGVEQHGGEASHLCGGEGVDQHGDEGEDQRGDEGVVQRGGEGVDQRGGEGVDQRGGEGVEQHGGEASHLCGGEGVDQHGDEGEDQRGDEGVVQRGGEGVDQRGGEGVDQRGGEGVDQRGGEGVDQRGGEEVDQHGDEGVDQRGGEASHLYGVEDSWFCAVWNQPWRSYKPMKAHLSNRGQLDFGGETRVLNRGQGVDQHRRRASRPSGEAPDLCGDEELGLRGDEVSDLRVVTHQNCMGHVSKPWSLWGQDTMTFHLLPEQLYLGGEAWDLNRGQGVHQHGRMASHLSGEASDLHGGEASDLHGGEELGLRGDEVSDLRGGEELGLRVVTCVKDPTEFMEREDKLGNSLQEPSSPQHHRASTSATIDMDWILELVLINERLFTPDVEETCNVKVYRFLASHAGRFFCCVTGLGFEVESGGEVTYSFCSWEKAPQTSSSWSPAGPIFDIECPQGTLKELHLPHCEMMFADENLAVAHVSNDNMEILHPLEVTDTHVVISITRLSGFGVIKRKESSKVRGQVLLLLRPKPQILNVFLLPLNVPPDQVHQQMQHRHNIFIPTSSMCTLIHKRRYRMSCNPKAIRRIQPKNEKFEYSFDQTIHPTFEVFLKRDVVEVDLSVLQDRSGKVVWRRFIDLTDAVLPSSITEEEDQSTGVAFVDQHREAIVQRVSLIEPLLDELHKHISEEKYDYICAAKTRQNKFRRLYEVLNCKKLKMLFFETLKKNEPHLVSELERS